MNVRVFRINSTTLQNRFRFLFQIDCSCTISSALYLHYFITQLVFFITLDFLINFTLYDSSVEYFVSLGWFYAACSRLLLLWLISRMIETNEITKAESNSVCCCCCYCGHKITKLKKSILFKCFFSEFV